MALIYRAHNNTVASVDQTKETVNKLSSLHAKAIEAINRTSTA